MTTFEIIKERVTVPQAAAYYGITSRNGMCCCFEHNDKHFLESINTLDYCEYIFDCFLNGNKDERLHMKREVECFEQRIYAYRRECITCVVGGKGKDKRTAVL